MFWNSIRRNISGKIWIAPEKPPVEEDEEEPQAIKLEDESWEHAFESMNDDDLVDLACECILSFTV